MGKQLVLGLCHFYYIVMAYEQTLLIDIRYILQMYMDTLAPSIRSYYLAFSLFSAALLNALT